MVELNLTHIGLQELILTPDRQKLKRILKFHWRNLLQNRGDWNISVYDMAWVLCCDFFTDAERNKHLLTLLSYQNQNGTWGNSDYVPHSGLIDTLAVMMACIHLSQPIPKLDLLLNAEIDNLILSCRDYLRHDTVAFEIIVPNLMNWLAGRGIEFQLSDASQVFIHKLYMIGEGKLAALLHGPGWFNAETSLSFSIEFAVLKQTPTDLDVFLKMLLPNGAIGLSPAATAAVITLYNQSNVEAPAQLYQYLQQTFEDYGRQGFPNLHPIETSRRLWNIRPWILSGNIFSAFEDPEIVDLTTEIYQGIEFDELGRVAWDTNNIRLPDLDDTAVAFALYAALGYVGVKNLYPMSRSSLQQFQRSDGSFFCYPFELHPSPAAILHALMAMDAIYNAPDTIVSFERQSFLIWENLLHQLSPRNKSFDNVWHDKWHATWTYGAQVWLSVRSIHLVYGEYINQMLEEVLAREQNGGWGEKAPTLEETSYIVAGLVTLLKSNEIVLNSKEELRIKASIKRARQYLFDKIMNNELENPALWISKNMYMPRFQVESAILNAIYSIVDISEYLDG